MSKITWEVREAPNGGWTGDVYYATQHRRYHLAQIMRRKEKAKALLAVKRLATTLRANMKLIDTRGVLCPSCRLRRHPNAEKCVCERIKPEARHLWP